MIVFLKLLLVHLIGDFIIQPYSWVADKESRKARSPKLYYHVLIHGALAWLVLFDLKAWPVALFIMVTHFFIDWAKLSLQDRKGQILWFVLDQFAHVLMLMIATSWWLDLPFHFWTSWWSDKMVVILVGGLLLTRPVSITMMVAMQPWARKLPDTGERSLESAGSFIGILERLLVYTFILLGSWQAIGFLIAAKSVFRFGDLRDAGNRKLTEYILIGTLLSFTIAVLVGLLTSAFIMFDKF